MDEEFLGRIDEAIQNAFSGHLAPYRQAKTCSSQAIANAVYALGMMGAKWSSFGVDAREALQDGIMEGLHNLKPQVRERRCR